MNTCSVTTMYWSVDILDPFDLLLQPEIKELLDANRSYSVIQDLHSTLFFGVSKEIDPLYTADTVVEIHIDAICYDTKCIALRVKSYQPSMVCHNKCSHVTLAVKNGCPPVYSNTLLESGAYIMIPIEVVVKGIVRFH